MHFEVSIAYNSAFLGFRPGLHLRTLTGVKLNNNWTQYSRPAICWQCNQDTEPELHYA